MIEIQNQEHFDKVKSFAESTSRMKQLQKQLDYLGNYSDYDTKCILGYDFAPYSFSFTMLKHDGLKYRHWFSGGMIFHGNHDNGGDGSGPTYSVCLNSTDGWSIHT